MSKWSQMRRHGGHYVAPPVVCPVLSDLSPGWYGLPSRPDGTWSSSFSPDSWTLRLYFGPDGSETLIYSDLGIAGSARTAASGYTISSSGRYQMRLVAVVGGSECAEVVLGTHTY